VLDNKKIIIGLCNAIVVQPVCEYHEGSNTALLYLIRLVEQGQSTDFIINEIDSNKLKINQLFKNNGKQVLYGTGKRAGNYGGLCVGRKVVLSNCVYRGATKKVF